ncbi:bone morphogenetic protein receptor type-1B-like [Paramacrobiotus metropolitanus]|uniref:bone morphogenetic protein receptor type-1B-like n=1 Tax=Paramacrobiotus metropolitanus TaxID=2943436 RepID=UPI002445BB28|nr:bone morphogenetic protein receptor type-1B-like [Paramacrobiotus metropolitanus]
MDHLPVFVACACCVIIQLFFPVFALDCFCEEDAGCPEHAVNNTCTAKGKSKCFASIRESKDASGHIEEIREYGCLGEDENSIMQCKGNKVPHRPGVRSWIVCCDHEDRCNEFLEPHLPTLPPAPEMVPAHKYLTWTIAAAVSFFVVAIACAFGFYCCYRRRKIPGDPLSALESQSLMGPLKLFSSSSAAKDQMEQSMTSGSGSGLPRLVQTTVARQLQFQQNIGRGRYGEVWLARYRDEKVAVKIFSTLDDASWESEKDLYQTCMLRHENILGFIAADIGGTGSCTQMLLITDFHMASLYDHLRQLQSRISIATMVKMAHTIACGLDHLHSGIRGTEAKPSIAHRDMKSKNILIKMDGVTCVIADFGLAIREDSMGSKMHDLTKREGTRRYMPPELLDDSIRRQEFDSYKRCDIYSLGLVLWEIARCADVSGVCEGYQLPFHGMVGTDPKLEEMRQVVCCPEKLEKLRLRMDDLRCRPVCQHGQRPPILDCWRKHEVTGKYVSLMEELWHDIPAVRSTALRTKKTLAQLLGNSLPSSP